MTKRPDPSFSKPPETDDIDDLWAEIDFGPGAGDAQPAPSDPFGLAEAPPPPGLSPAPDPDDPIPAGFTPAPDADVDPPHTPFTPAPDADMDPPHTPGFTPPPVPDLHALHSPAEDSSYAPPSIDRPSSRARTSPEPVVQRHIDEMRSQPAAARRAATPAPLPLGFHDESENSGGDALDLVEQSLGTNIGSPDEAAELGSSPSDMQDRYAVGDFTGALVIAESILETDPEDEDALRYAASCREVLTQMYSARLGPLDQVARVAIPAEQITWLSLDHRAGFLLSLVDGESTVEELLDISGMTRLEALRIMYTLVQQRVVTIV